MDLAHAFGLAFKIAIAAMTVATGLATTTGDIAYLFRNKALLARSLLATMVIAPLVAIALCRVLPVGAAATIAIVAGSLAPGLPSVPRTGRAVGGNAAFACSLMVVTSALGAITIPFWLSIIGVVTGIEPAVTPLAIARTLATGILIPLAVGLAVRKLAPSAAERLAGPLGSLASALLPGLALVLMIVGAGAIRQLGAAAIAVMLIVPIVALAVGHALGGPDPRDRTVLAISNATRFPALAALIAHVSFPDVRAVPAVVAYLLIAMFLSLPYELWRKRVHARAPREQPPQHDGPVIAVAPRPLPTG